MKNNLTKLEHEIVNSYLDILLNQKLIIIINGSGGVGKDTICNVVSKYYKVLNISSIDPIKKIAYENGWNGEKDDKSRKFLSDLKTIFAEYNNISHRYLLERYYNFLNNSDEIMFVHIREPHDIDQFKNSIKYSNCISLLIRRNINKSSYGNIADDGVENYNYDFYYDNTSPLNKVENDFMKYFENTIRKQVKSEKNLR